MQTSLRATLAVLNLLALPEPSARLAELEVALCRAVRRQRRRHAWRHGKLGSRSRRHYVLSPEALAFRERAMERHGAVALGQVPIDEPEPRRRPLAPRRF